MSTKRDSHLQQSPPPPYDSKTGFASMSERALAPSSITCGADRNQTVPKTSEHHLCDSSASRGARDLHYHCHQPILVSRRHQSRERRSSHQFSTGGDNYELDHHHRHGNRPDEFVNSLAAPKSLLRHISVEPLAFLAIVALYLEFPAIQDLIYTKICLEVVSGHRIQSVWSSPPQTNSNFTPFPQNANAPSLPSLPTNGRIQQLNSSATSTTTHFGSTPAVNEDLHLICDRLNKTAVPLEIRRQILDLNSLFWLKYQILTCLFCALCSPYWGGISDKIGRILPLNVPIVASVLCNSISLAFGLLISLNSHALFHINWLYAGALLVGLSGGQVVLLMNAFSFISDNTTQEERSKRVTVLESVVVVAHSVGFFLGKLIMSLGLASPHSPWLNRHFVAFAVCILLDSLCLVYSLARLRHHTFHKFLNNFEREQQEAVILGADNLAASNSSLTHIGADKEPGGQQAPAVAAGAQLASAQSACGSMDRLRELTSSTPDDPDGPIARSDKSNWSVWDTLITFKYYRETFQIATKPRDTRAIILLLLLSGFISALSLAALMSLLFIYVKMDPFNWSTSRYSSWNAISSITRGIALIALTLAMKFAPSWNVPDALVAGVGFLAKATGLLMLGLAQSSALINWSLVAFTLSEFSMPPIRSLLSKLVVKEELCKVYSCLGALQSLCFILGNVAFYVAFNSYMKHDFFRLGFLMTASIEFGALILMLLIHTIIRGRIIMA